MDDEVRAALAAADDPSALPQDRAEMLMEIAMGPKSHETEAAIDLYERASAICPTGEHLLSTRIASRLAPALLALPIGGADALERARTELEKATRYRPEQGAHHRCISAYQRALRTFDRVRFPKEFAILQNNLATAFLSMPFTDSRAKMLEALAMQAFEEGLKIVNLIDHPTEYAMLQNNVDNALQYASSSHVVENDLRALEAYDEDLKVRTRAAMPLEYTNTIANKANCLWNLPDHPADPGNGNRANLTAAREYYRECREIFLGYGEADNARIVAEACEQIDRALLSAPAANSNGLSGSAQHHFN
ncbi:hypothetical protein [Mesorhizobium sp.]|uniref:hypothetical protein n=1 Tax=Mesorhizobium sp. TaxID=1871066 RepID=UPI0025BAD50F|nr:hypothetical protein [Mesorhizobium sp.]